MKSLFTVRWKLIWIVILIGLCGLSWAGFRYWGGAKSSKISYRKITVQPGELKITILSTGVVQPENRLEIKPPIAGRVEKILVDEGYKVTKGQILAWMSSSERAALLDAAIAKGPAELRRWKKLFRPTPILAPINGMIIKRNIEDGQTFTQQDAILVMSDRLTVKAQVDETDMAQVRLGQKASIVLDAYSEVDIPAKVEKIAFDATTVSNVTTYVVDVIPIHTPDSMRSGMTANVTFEVAGKSNVLLVPSSAIKATKGKTLVLISKGKDEPPVEREIEVGLSDKKQIEVIGGLENGDVVLVPEFQRKESAPSSSNPLSPMSHPTPKR